MCVYLCRRSIQELEMSANVVVGVLPLQSSPPISRLEVWRSRGLVYWVPVGQVLAGLLLALE